MTPSERAEFIADVAAAIQATPITLSDDERRWVRMAIQREAEKAALRKAIIEKSLAGLVWSALVALGYIFVEFAKNHGLK